MGIRGLKTFIESHDGLYEKNCRLHDTPVVVDANNLIPELFMLSQKHERRDLFGGDMVQFGRYLRQFFANLRVCNIAPILVVDGAQTHDDQKSKTKEKQRRSIKRFQKVMSINRTGFGDFILPASTTNVFRSMAVDQGLQIVQCMYEADTEVARISHDLKCPVISNDSDFFLMDLPYGLIGIDLLAHERVLRHEPQPQSQHHGKKRQQHAHVVAYNYLECDIFKQKNFARYLPDLDVRSLPLMGVLAGNDFVGERVFEQICAKLPSRCLKRDAKPNARAFRKPRNQNKQHTKILKILHYLSDKSPNESINQICQLVGRERRQELKRLIKSNLRVYDVPVEDDFAKELERLYWRGFVTARRGQLGDDQDTLRAHFDSCLANLIAWLKHAMERSVLSYRCLELANRNTLFIQGHMDDPTLPSAHQCQWRPMRVMQALLRSHYKESNSCDVYDRIGDRYEKQKMEPLASLENFGPLKYIFADLPQLPPEVRRSILFATFHTTAEHFDRSVAGLYLWLESRNADEFHTLKLLMDFVNIESKGARLWKEFRHATLLCALHHFHRVNRDEMLSTRLTSESSRGAPSGPASSDEQDATTGAGTSTSPEFLSDFLNALAEVIKQLKLARVPRLGPKRKYNCRLMHQITQLQCSITSFNLLNALLGDTVTRLRTEGWLNSCLIYNLAEGLRTKALRLSGLSRIGLVTN